MATSNVVAYAANGYRYNTNFAADGSYTLATFLNGRLISSARKTPTHAVLTSATFSYDAHGRQNATTDARNGTTADRLYYGVALQP